MIIDTKRYFCAWIDMHKNNTDILLLSATAFEIAPLYDHLKEHWEMLDELTFKKQGRCINILIGGVGLVATAFHLTRKLTERQFGFVLQLGVAGAFPAQKIALGDLVWVQADKIADLGVLDSGGSFLDLEHIGLNEPSSARFPAPEPPDEFSDLLRSLQKAEGASVNCIHGDPDVLRDIPSGASPVHVESMEGAAMHFVCTSFKVPFAQVRSISNWVEPRDKSRWRMQEAIASLNDWAIRLVKKFAPGELLD